MWILHWIWQLIAFAACLAAANAGYVPSAYAASPLGYSAAAAPAISSVSSNTIRSFGNVGQVSTYSKTLDTPFSSVRKSDIRVTNDGYRPAYAQAAYAAPAYAHAGYAAPVAKAYLG